MLTYTNMEKLKTWEEHFEGKKKPNKSNPKKEINKVIEEELGLEEK